MRNTSGRLEDARGTLYKNTVWKKQCERIEHRHPPNDNDMHPPIVGGIY